MTNKKERSKDKIYAFLGLTNKTPIKGIGLEVEMEFANIFDILVHRIEGGPEHKISWTPKVDGSLRNGIEMVSNVLIPDNVEKALELLFNSVHNPVWSQRTSIHSHYNVKNFTFIEAYNAILGFWVFEDCLIHLCDPKRFGNPFCLPWTLAEGQVTSFVNDIKNKTKLMSFNQDRHKYSAFNIAPVNNLGTFEFRALEGSNDIKKITTIVLGIRHLLDELAKEESPDKMFNFFFQHKRNPDALLEKYFTPDLCDMLLSKFSKGYKESIEKSMINLSYAAYLDWNGSINEPRESPDQSAPNIRVNWMPGPMGLAPDPLRGFNLGEVHAV